MRRIDAANPAERDHVVIALEKGALDALDIELDVDTLPADNVKGVLVAANHMSWPDIFVPSAVYPRIYFAGKESYARHQTA